MSESSDRTSPAEERQRRLAEALRANLRRRKQQARDRRQDSTDTEATEPGGPSRPSGSGKVNT